jgi:hypothetical protein
VSSPGHVLLLEYLEERPLMMLQTGMGMRLTTYYRYSLAGFVCIAAAVACVVTWKHSSVLFYVAVHNVMCVYNTGHRQTALQPAEGVYSTTV